MSATKLFPYVSTTRAKDGVEGVAGLRLDAMLKGNLIGDERQMSDPQNRLNPRRLQTARESLVQSLSAWPPSLGLELQFTSMPNLAHRPRSLFSVDLYLRARSDSEESVKEEVIGRYLALSPLLAAHVTEAEFLPITDRQELETGMCAFPVAHAMSVCRRNEVISLSAPLQRSSMGFLNGSGSERQIESTIRHLYPWVPSLDDWGCLVDTIMGQIDPVRILVRLRTAASEDGGFAHISEEIATCESFLAGCNAYQVTLQRQVDLIRRTALRRQAEIARHRFDVGVFLLAAHPIDGVLGNVLGRAITGPRSAAEDDHLFDGGFDCREVGVEEALDPTFFPEAEAFSLTEAACAFRLPSPQIEECMGVPLRRSRTSLALFTGNAGPVRQERDTIELFLNVHRGMTQPVNASPDDRMRHMFILGQTGTGKSTLMERMIVQDIRAGRGVGVIDPHGDLIESLLGKIPPERADDLVLIDLLDEERPVGFNVIEWDTIEERDLIIDELYLTLDRIYDMQRTGGPIFESNFRGMLKLLMGDKPNEQFQPTLLEFTSCYQNSQFRKKLMERTQDPQLSDFVEELENTRGDASIHNLSPYITSKFGRFIQDVRLRRILGQQKTTFDFDEVMNQGRIFLVKLGKGRFGATVSALLVNQMVARFKLSAMKRADIAPEKRRDFFLYVDECHNLPPENFTELLSEARKQRMGLVLATQYADQLKGHSISDQGLLPAVLGNVGAIVLFRLGTGDALEMSQALAPYFGPLDIIGLSNWNGYVRMQPHGEAMPPFSFRTEKDAVPFNREMAEKVRALARLKCGNNAALVEQEISERRRHWGISKGGGEKED